MHKRKETEAKEQEGRILKRQKKSPGQAVTNLAQAQDVLDFNILGALDSLLM